MTATSTSTLEALGNRAEIADFGRHEVLESSVDFTHEKFYVDAARLVSDMQMVDLVPKVLGLDTETPVEEHAEGQSIR